MQYYHFTTLDSTNTWAKKNIQNFSPKELTIITADAQTAGRGRFNRTWVSPAGKNLYITFCFFEKNLSIGNNISQVLALSMIHVLEKMDFQICLKWPNDLLISNKKVAGVLCETSPVENLTGWILGLGLNVNMTQEELKIIDRPATSLFQETLQLYSIKAIQEELVTQFKQDLDLFLKKGFPPFYPQYLAHSHLKKGDLIHFHVANQVWEGTFHSIQGDGALVIEQLNGQLQTFYSGELIDVENIE